MVPATTQAQQWSGIVAPGRAVDWSNAGVVGGIPARPTICSTLNPGTTAAQINAALAACTPGQTVFLNAGTYSIGGIDFTGHSGVTLRGAGADQTFILFTGNTTCFGATADICIQSGDNNWRGGPSNVANWTAGYAKGTTSITLSSVPNLKVGSPIILDQLDDTSDSGAIFVCQSTSFPCSLEGNANAQRTGRDQVQIVVVTQCDGVTTIGHSCVSGTNVVISPGLYMPNWSAANSPGAWWASSPIHDSGVENLSLDHTGASGGVGIEIDNCVNCWVKGVRSIDSARAHFQLQVSTHVTIRDNYAFLTQNSVSQSYGAECDTGSDYLIENNIFQAVSAPEILNGGCSGVVVGYNFSINNFYTGSSGYSLAGMSAHTAGVDNVLLEGNFSNQFYGDLFHGTHNFINVFRNYIQGWQPACWISGSPYASATFGPCNNNLMPIVLLSYSRFFNIVGNVLGHTGTQTGYTSGTPIYSIGNGNSNNTVTVPSDPNVGLTLMRWGNYDTVNGAPQWNASEIPNSLNGAQALFSNPVPASQSLPASFYLNSKPSWWTAGKPWPAIGPDVTGGNVSGVGGHVYSIPAQDCYLNTMGGPVNGTGPVLTFNASKCYPGSNATLPAAPTGLNVVVH